MPNFRQAVLLFSFISQSSLVQPFPSSGGNGNIARRDGDISGSATQGTSLKCHGVGGDVWMISQDQAMSAAHQFCWQDSKDKEREYFQGSVDDVKMSLHSTDHDPNSISVGDCVAGFAMIVEACDGNDPINNPHNHKFGGTYTSPDGWEFKLEPQAQKPNEDTCDVSYKFLLDAFEVRGKNFPDARLGGNGEGLWKAINHCGAITNWKFQWTPNDVKYQWFASGRLPIGTKSCVGHAVKHAGGSTAGNCHGPG